MSSHNNARQKLAFMTMVKWCSMCIRDDYLHADSRNQYLKASRFFAFSVRPNMASRFYSRLERMFIRPYINNKENTRRSPNKTTFAHSTHSPLTPETASQRTYFLFTISCNIKHQFNFKNISADVHQRITSKGQIESATFSFDIVFRRRN